MLLVLAGAGCGGKAKEHSSAAPLPANGKLIITPETRLVGKVVSFDPDGRFAVLNFPIGHLPAVGQQLGIYRFGLKVGELKVTGPQRDDNIVGDVITGEARQGDEVRE
jgi:hypothetical protein